MTDVIFVSGALTLSFFVGGLTGVYGVGGGFLLTPALIILLGVDSSVAVGTGLATFFVTSSVGIYQRKGTGTVDYRLAALIGLGIVVGVIFGQRMLVWLSFMRLYIGSREVSAVSYVLMWAFLVLLAGLTVLMKFRPVNPDAKSLNSKGLVIRWALGPKIRLQSLQGRTVGILPLVLIGMAVGLLTGFMGIGGGVLLLPVLMYLVGLTPVCAAGTSLALVWLSAVTAVFLHACEGTIVISLLLIMVLGGAAGTWLGTLLGLKLPGDTIRSSFVYVLVAAVLLVAYKLFDLTFCGV